MILRLVGLYIVAVIVWQLLLVFAADVARTLARPFTMFHDDCGDWSMTRVVAAGFAYTICKSLAIMAAHDHLHDVGVPFAIIAIATLLAVPVQALIKMLVAWFKSKPGAELVGKLVSKIGDVNLGGLVGHGMPGVIETKTTVNPSGAAG